MTEDFLDASLLRLDKLEHMFDNRLPVDVSCLPFSYSRTSDKVADDR